MPAGKPLRGGGESHPRRRLGLFVAAFLLLAAGGFASAAASDPRPNVILILADDLGYLDLGVNNPGTFYETPNLDGLAARGMNFTAGYAACPVCSPTRASIMTGKYPLRTGITDYIGGHRGRKLLPAPNRDHLALAEVTLAETLRDAGYTNFFAGKWHLGKGPFSPSAQGFSAALTGTNQFYYPETDLPPPDKTQDPKTTDRIAEEAVRFIAANEARPFFAFLPFLAVHTAIQARPELVEKYQRKRATAPPDAMGREGQSPLRLVQNHAAYAAMLEQMDSAIGRVLAALDHHGLGGRTIIIFTSDNGGLATSEGTPTSNLPLRAGKGWAYEGGVRVPLIIHAPGVTRPGTTCESPVISMDFYPTILELAGLPALREQHVDGRSLVPLLKGGRLERAPLFWHYPHYGNQGGAPFSAIRDGDLKLIEWFEEGRLELYNLRKDIGETNNLADRQPAVVAALHTQLKSWRANLKAVLPTHNPDFPATPQSPANTPDRKLTQ